MTRGVRMVLSAQGFGEEALSLLRTFARSINHLRLTVTNIQRAERFYRPLMRFMEYELCDCEENRLTWAKWSSSGVFWLILTRARQDTKPARHDLLSPGFHHLAWNADKISRQKRSKT